MNDLQQEELKDLEVSKEFRITDLSSANWAFKKINVLETKIKEAEFLAQNEIDRIQEWKCNVTKADQESIIFFQSLLKQYFIENRQVDSKFKLSTPYGKVITRKVQKWQYDDDMTKDWCKKNEYQDYIRVKEELNKTKFRSTFKNAIDPATGECIPGVSIVTEELINFKTE